MSKPASPTRVPDKEREREGVAILSNTLVILRLLDCLLVYIWYHIKVTFHYHRYGCLGYSMPTLQTIMTFLLLYTERERERESTSDMSYC